MTEPKPDEDLARVPGLYRRWELVELVQPNRSYRIEDAGQHADGTPLLAVYTDAAEAAPLETVPVLHLPHREG